MSGMEESMMNEEDIVMMREVFNIFDLEKQGRIPVVDVGSVMRVMGHNPSQATVKSLLSFLDVDKITNTVGFSSFAQMMSLQAGTVDYLIDLREDELVDAFAAFDEGKGYVPTGDFKEFLSTLGETLSDKEVNEMIASMALEDDNKVTYKEFAGFVQSFG